MEFSILCKDCKKGDTFPLIRNFADLPKNLPAHYLNADNLEILPANYFDVGNLIIGAHNQPLFMVSGQAYFSLNKGIQVISNDMESGNHIILSNMDIPCSLLTALEDIKDASNYNTYKVIKRGWSLAIITLSDKGFCGKRKDTAGPLIAELINSKLNLSFCKNILISDDASSLRSLLTDLACQQFFDLIITTGGTGIGPRDITPQITERLLDYNLPGFVQAMTGAGLQKTPMAAISRAAAGIIERSIIINLPGSPKAVKENLDPLLPALEHALLKLHGDTTDCAELYKGIGR